MKKLLLGLIVLGSISSFAGEIENRNTGQVIKAIINNNVLEIDLASVGAKNKVVDLDEVGRSIDHINTYKNYYLQKKYLFPMSTGADDVIDYSGNIWGEYDMNYGQHLVTMAIPLYNIPLVLTTGIDIAILPFTFSRGLISRMQDKKLVKVITKGLLTEQKMKVNSRVFLKATKVLKSLKSTN